MMINKFILALALVLTPFFSLSLTFPKFMEDNNKVSAAAVPQPTSLYCVSVIDVDNDICPTTGVKPAGSPETAANSWVSWAKPQYAPVDSYEVNCAGLSCSVTFSRKNIHDTLAVFKNFNLSIKEGVIIQFICPPPNDPLFVVSFDSDGDTEIDACALMQDYDEYVIKEQNECPDGFFQFKVFTNDPAGECVPISCDSEGTTKSIWATGSVYGNTQGTYCDGSCAHSVGGGQNDSSFQGNISVSATSTGAVCGQGHPDDQWFDEGNGDECQKTTSSAGSDFLSCPIGDGSGEEEENPDTETETTDLGENKIKEEEIPTLIPIEETCSGDDPSCEIRNLKETLISESLEGKELDMLRHNKSIDAQQTSNENLIEAIDKLRESNEEGASSVGDGDGEGDGECDLESNCGEGGVEIRTEPLEGLEGFWKTEYENGLQGVMEEKINSVKATEFFLFIQSFNPSISGGTAPSFKMCFNLGALGNYGCKNFSIDPRVYPAIRIFILITAGFLCRKVLFGG